MCSSGRSSSSCPLGHGVASAIERREHDSFVQSRGKEVPKGGRLTERRWASRSATGTTRRRCAAGVDGVGREENVEEVVDATLGVDEPQIPLLRPVVIVVLQLVLLLLRCELHGCGGGVSSGSGGVAHGKNRREEGEKGGGGGREEGV